jgi:hypothetical protein
MEEKKASLAYKVLSIARSASAKKPYKVPRLTVYGNVARLTAAVHHSHPGPRG